MKKLLFPFFVALCVQGKSQVFLEQVPDSIWLAIEDNWVCEITPYENRMEAGYKETCLYSKQLFFADTLANDLRNYFNQAELYELQQGKVIIHSNGFTLEPKPYLPTSLGFLNMYEENLIYEVIGERLVCNKTLEPRKDDCWWVKIISFGVLFMASIILGTILSIFQGSILGKMVGVFIAGVAGIFFTGAILGSPLIMETIILLSDRTRGEIAGGILSEIFYIYFVMKSK
ncbi:MAG: hypothetical protein KBC98_00355 [Candidatus Pacebacteria bacterium]|jgi:hypothetical protein|nr:hypothetical protein [Candidatus Paceibacterota bacterium]